MQCKKICSFVYLTTLFPVGEVLYTLSSPFEFVKDPSSVKVVGIPKEVIGIATSEHFCDEFRESRSPFPKGCISIFIVLASSPRSNSWSSS